MKLVEIKEDNLCPRCGERLFFRMMPPRSEVDMRLNIDVKDYAWHCSRCDKYFKEEKEKVLKCQ
jgi:DNA-directed RNA polymerase subunit RPC12/RpoP